MVKLKISIGNSLLKVLDDDYSVLFTRITIVSFRPVLLVVVWLEIN